MADIMKLVAEIEAESPNGLAMPRPPEWQAIKRALQMVSILAATPPNDWLSKSEIHAALAEFRPSVETAVMDEDRREAPKC